ncbi:glycoside hydrolase family 2 TIM barrel-domain containing protein [Niabella insulamsoli]|uniref:glycoside hydrolase family 2 TIM barrel-domain containing protein n=1 Tax=Niabella insulamsoli TaxID=3144874 RepID=UPI0031FCF16F
MLARYFLTVLLMISWGAYGQPGFGNARKINEDWSFILNLTDTTGALPAATARWQPVDLPHDWSVKQPLDPAHASCMGYLPGGIGWYKKTMYLPRQQGKCYLYFEGVYNRSEVFVNGKSVDRRPNGYVSFIYDISNEVRWDSANTILVKVDHHRSADSRWYTGSGIYRDVWLVMANTIHIDTWGVYAYPELGDDGGKLHIETNIKNSSDRSERVEVAHQLTDPAGVVVAAASQSLRLLPDSVQKEKTALSVKSPRLWSLGDPALYRLKTIITRGGKIIDSNTTTTGFRKFTFDPDKGFALNDVWMKVKGVCLHHDAGVLGAAMYKDVWSRRLLQLKQLGCNAVRTSHNPQATALYELCDELGLLVLNEAFDEWEFPKRKWLEGWNVGMPGYQGSFDFFEAWGARDLADMVSRDRNHLSVFAWSIGNEVDYPNDPYSHPILDGNAANGFTQKIFGGYKKQAPDANRLGDIAKRLVAVVKQYDRSRPVTAGLAGVAMSNETAYPGALDIAGYNYTESRYTSDHQKYPKRVLYGSENRHDLAAWKAVTDNKHIFGQFLWTGIDYLGESGKWPSRGFYSGLLDFAGFIKPRGYYRQSLWSEAPMAYLGTYPTPEKQERRPSMDAWPLWNYSPQKMIRVVCYTNQPQARLSLNGQVRGAIAAKDPETGIIFWDLPFEEGELKVEALGSDGSVAATDQIRTAGPAHAIRVVSVTKPHHDGIFQVALQITDATGRPVLDAENEITCTVEAPGRLLGLENANNKDMGDYTDNKQAVFKGRLLAYVKMSGLQTATVRFISPGLQPAAIPLEGIVLHK